MLTLVTPNTLVEYGRKSKGLTLLSLGVVTSVNTVKFLYKV
jgi:hypothetical protein